jgi:multidrug efflux system outer membrane protein
MRLPPPASTDGLHTEALLARSAMQGADQSSSAATWPAARWWEQYGWTELNGLVSRALHDAPTLVAAQARVTAASAAVDIAFADSRLQVTGEAQLQRQRLSDNGLFPPKLLAFQWYSPSDLGITARYDLDPGGRHQAEERFAIAHVALAEAERAAAELMLSDAVVRAYMTWQIDHAGYEIAQQTITSLDREIAIAGARAAAELARADESVSLQEARHAALERAGEYRAAMQLSQVAIAALTQVEPDSMPPLTAQSLAAPHSALPARASLDLMARRPDLIAARARVAAAGADTDVARAGYLPDVDLRALLGLSSRDVEHLLQSGSWAPQFSAALHLPLFDAGRIRARHAGAQAELQATVADYNERLLRAAESINVALTERAAAGVQWQLRAEQTNAAATLRNLAQQRTDAGLSDMRPVLAATRHWLEKQDAQLQSRRAQWMSELNLIRALGGGYGTGE